MPYITLNLVFIGMILLGLYIVIDIIRQKNRNIIKRLVFYSFLFYSIVVIELTTGGITIPPTDNPLFRWQLIPFHFIYDWFSFDRGSWFFWNAVKLSFFNFILLFPLGVYLSILYKVKKIKKAALIVFLTSLTIEAYQFVLGYFGFVFARTINIDDLILNTFGGTLGFITFEWIRKKIANKKFNS
ncbi:glycopeptide antibiotics resistance protein [Natronobacillus azotifigens]|uniref:VanZ family protein n=1 Tax=Natronobacillus azotifigens TaxID=472978 RepID=A0A9J6RCX2_9BACI|nr:VanZ family protein [Natronobacillus azotifigens]MCZ0703065.1 VanZ family protein [Natronobacillus azotifigens]